MTIIKNNTNYTYNNTALMAYDVMEKVAALITSIKNKIHNFGGKRVNNERHQNTITILEEYYKE